MRTRLAIVLALIVVVPTALLIGLGLRLARHEQDRVRSRFEGLMQERLDDVAETIARLLEERETELRRSFELSEISAESLRGVSLSSLIALQAFALDPEGLLLYPTPGNAATSREWDFLERAHDVLASKALLQESSAAGEGPAAPAAQGWYHWFWGRDIRLLFWTRDPQGRILGVEVDLVPLLADIIAHLPDTPTPAASDGEEGLAERIRLLDSRGDALYQWGRYEPPAAAAPLARLALSAPLSAWSLEYYLPPQLLASQGQGALAAVAAGTVLLAILLGGLAVYFYRESSRELRVAEQRVTFVNQVSHELKTPLTNIRMYAELLSDRVGEEDEGSRRHAQIIVSESERLSRLIGNILSFGRKQRNALTLHRSPGIVDVVIRGVLEHYRPGLEAVDVRIDTDLAAAHQVSFDPDALEQILGNLLSNVEKYAASGGGVTIKSRQEAGKSLITVADKGPGIPSQDAERIFQPFFRISNRLTDGVSGAGIGLSIARDLARLHGGDLVLRSSDQGAAFQLILATPQEETPVES